MSDVRRWWKRKGRGRADWSGGALTAVAAATGLLVGVRSIAMVELPRIRPLLGLDSLTRDDLGISWTGDAVWPADLQAVGLERLVVVLVALVLSAALVATLNAVILLAESAASRRRELAVRSALGASRSVLAREMAAELRPLLAAGAGLGVVLGLGAGGLARLVWPDPLLAVRPFALGDLLLALVATLVVVAVAHVGTALQATHGPRAAAALRAGARTGTDPMGVFVRKALTAGHTAIAGGLLVAALALTSTVDETSTAGLAAGGETGALAATFAVTAPGPASWRRVLAEIGEIPGMEAETLAAPGALVGLGIREIAIAECGRCSRGGMPAPLWIASADHYAVAPGFFDLAGVELVEGRDFGASDGAAAERVAIVNETFAWTAFELGRPIGKKVRIGADFASWYTVVGIVADDALPTLGADESARSAVYVNALQQPPRAANVIVRGSEEAVEAARAFLAGAGYAPSPAARVSEYRAAAAEPLRWAQRSAALIALLALGLAAHGVYATALQTTRRQVGELAVRRALGAAPRRIAVHVLGGRFRVVCWGLAGFAFLGTLVVALLQKAAGLPAVSPLDYGAIAALLVVVALAASARAAKEALGLDPAAHLE